MKNLLQINLHQIFSLHAARAAALACPLLLVACATPPGETAGTNGKTTAGASAPETKLPAPGPTPTVLITGRKPQAILDDIVKFRTGKGMSVRSRSSMRVEFAESVPNASQPTEARMLYLLSPASKGLNLSARVFQVSYPGTARERVAEVTSVVADKLSKELAGYNTNSGW
ncbi:hypothetical protein [Silvimonas amylolytica]|uniref:Lipoprotein n=1 Tax=Silvimonas amylolytica TaxID=449663 RepID=A0ABQ2PQS2_9NEIS|nr:hypothetical protein [Silvimonas amylolytica]GGP27746.1 hypothetical protein GCM10010971_35650 [Silvimonas amylolytica]